MGIPLNIFKITFMKVHTKTTKGMGRVLRNFMMVIG